CSVYTIVLYENIWPALDCSGPLSGGRLLRQKHYKKRLSGRFLLCPIKLSIGTGKCYRFKGQVK
ncbi:MAG: hypothetical protein WB476_10305, partial [Azonexus sp.]